MAALFDDLITEGTALLSITTHIANFLVERRSERTFLVETEAFFDYIQECVEEIRKFVEEATDPSRGPSTNRILADLRDLKALKFVVNSMYRFVRQTCDADTLAVPYPIIAYINSLMGRVPRFTNAVDAKILALATDELNFLHHRLSALGWACEQCTHLPKFPPNLGIIAFPYTERDSICLNALLFHEIGHFLFQKSQAANDLAAALSEMKEKVREIASSESLFGGPIIIQQALDCVLNWCQELYCDLIGTVLAGPSYFIAFDRMFRLIYVENERNHFTHRYPPDQFRRSCIALMLEDLGWIKAIEDCDPEKSNEPFVTTARAQISFAWIKSQPNNSFPAVDDTKFQFPIDKPDLAKLLVSSFFAVVPRVFELVRNIRLHLPDYDRDFRENYTDVTDSLMHLTVPQVAVGFGNDCKFVDPVTILACGSLLLSRDLSGIHSLCGRTNAQQIKAEHRLWVEDKINRLVMKAIEDALVVARWSQPDK